MYPTITLLEKRGSVRVDMYINAYYYISYWCIFSWGTFECINWVFCRGWVVLNLSYASLIISTSALRIQGKGRF